MYDIDRKSGTIFWTKVIEKDMENVHNEFDRVDSVSPANIRKRKIIPGYDHVGINMIFEIRIDGKFTRKILVYEGNTTDPQFYITYSRVVFREIISIKLLLVSLKILEIFSCEIENVYLKYK